MPGTFGLTELKKGYFAYLFNRKENKKYRGKMPPIQDYHLEAVSLSEQDSIRAWYGHQKDIYSMKLYFWKHVLLHIDPKTIEPVEYDHQKELLAYCSSDVDILRRSCLCFRKLFLDVANCDPFQKITIASVCMNIYRSSHIPSSIIAVVKENRQKYSKASM